MLFLILATDHPGMDAKRESLRAAHRAYLAAQGSKLLASGALLADDGAAILGGASLIDLSSRGEAESFERNDPYGVAGIRAKVEILPWRLRWWMGQFDKEGKAWRMTGSQTVPSNSAEIDCNSLPPAIKV